MSDPTYITKSAELAEAMEPTHQQAADWAATYKRMQNPAAYVLSDGETMHPSTIAKELKDLNKAIKHYIEANGDLDVEGVGCLTVQYPQSSKVDLISLHQYDSETFFRLLQLGCLQVNMPALEAQEKAGNIAAEIPRMPVAQTARLIWRRDDQ